MKRIKYPSTQIARERFGATSTAYKRIKALEKWAVDHGYDGYKAINRRTREDKKQQTSLL
jgi:hypothetical protein